MTYSVYGRLANLVAQPECPCDVGRPNVNRSAPYCFVWGKLPIADSLTAAGSDSVIDTDLHLQVVDTSQANALKRAHDLAERINGEVLTIPGWRVFPLRVIDSTDLSGETQVIEPSTNIPEGVISLEIRFQATKE